MILFPVAQEFLTRISHSVNISESHLLQALLTVELIVSGMSLFSHILHVSANEHFTKLDKVTMSFVFNLNDPLKIKSLNRLII